MNIKKSLDRYWSWYNEVLVAGKWLAYLKTLPPAPNELAYEKQIENFKKRKVLKNA